jgi:hypothetical protein
LEDQEHQADGNLGQWELEKHRRQKRRSFETVNQETLKRIEAVKKAAIPPRLVKGAVILGRLWVEGNRCLGEWSGICPCPAQNDFCEVKKKWLSLVRDLYDGKYPHDLSGCEGFLVLECMDGKMFEASGLTILKTVPGARVPIRVGRKGTCLQTILDLAALEGTADYAAAVESVVRIQEVGL